MSREIKFKAWNKDENAMTPVFEFPEPMQLMAQTAELLSKSPNFNHLVWLQYTGLKDKNGVEIYEGDVLTGGAVVKWYDNLTWDGGGSPHPGFYCEAWCQYKDDGELSYHQGFNIKEYEIEVIGNIYEAPGLLDSTSKETA